MRPNIHRALAVPAASGPLPAASAETLTATLPGQAALIVAASLFVAAAAHLSVPLPFTPVPLTLGDLAVLLVGLALGPRAAFAALTLYLAEGAAGLPVFSSWGVPGIAHLVGPTGGYLLAYPFAAALISSIAGGLKRYVPAFVAGTAGAVAATLVIMTFGTIWLGVFSHLSISSAVTMGALPFLPGGAAKIVCAGGIFATQGGRRS